MSLQAYWAFDEAGGSKAIEKIAGKASNINYVFNNARYKPSSDPLWMNGIKGTSLLFDGFSTWIEENRAVIKNKSNSLTIEAWVAPRCHEYNENNNITAIINKHNEEKIEGFVLGLRAFGELCFKIGSNGKWYELNCDETPIPLNKWSYITAVFNGESGLVELYINGNKASCTDVPKGSLITPSSENLLIGRSNNAVRLEGVYEVGCYCGLMDELKIYNNALNTEEVQQRYDEYIESFHGQIPEPNLSIDRSIYEGDRHRPNYHFISPGFWMNEPHGPMYFNGKYHLFFQHNPHGPLWRQIHWGHVVSEDMVHWRDVPCALIPEKGKLDEKGDWSGCAIVDEGTPTIIYTAGDGPIYSQCAALARSTFKEDGDLELKNWVKEEAPLILQDKDIATEKGKLHFGQFRDPFVWREEDTYYAIIGSGIKDEKGSVGGTALMYTSKDLYHWKYEKPLFIGDYEKYPKTGEVWELPVFLPVRKDKEGNMKHILLINPWFFSYSPHNVKYVWYWLGTWDSKNLDFTPDTEEPRLLDVGEHFTGQSGFVDPKGRTIIFSIAQGRRTKLDEIQSGWAHNGGLPISLFIREDGQLGIEPIEELQSLRELQYVDIENITMEEANKRLSSVKGDSLEIQMELDGGASQEFGIKIRRTPNEEEETLLYYNKSAKEFFINREKSTLNKELQKGIQGGAVLVDPCSIKLHIFLDKSMVEVYINKLKGLTSRVYPTREDALGLLLWADCKVETAKVKSLKIWKLSSAY